MNTAIQEAMRRPAGGVTYKIAVLSELTLGGVQMTLSQALAWKSQPPQDGERTAVNDCAWREAA